MIRSSLGPAFSLSAFVWTVLVAVWLVAISEGAETVCWEFPESSIRTTICETEAHGIAGAGTGVWLVLLIPMVSTIAGLYASVHQSTGGKIGLLCAAIWLSLFCLSLIFSWGWLYLPAALLLLIAATLHGLFARSHAAARKGAPI